MSTKLIISDFNPLRFYDYETWMPGGDVLSFQDSVYWAQPWQKSDTITIQLQSDTDGLTLVITDESLIAVRSVPFVLKTTNWKTQGLQIYEASISLSGLPVDEYFIAIKKDGNFISISDRINVFDNVDNSIYLQYHHRKNKADLAFDTSIQFSIRVPSVLQDFQPSVDDTVYIDQFRRSVVLDSTPFRTYKIVIGDAYGVPDYIASKVNRIFGLSTVTLDGIAFSKSENAKLERNSDRLYPFSGWTLDITEVNGTDTGSIDVGPIGGIVVYGDRFGNIYGRDKQLFGVVAN